MVEVGRMLVAGCRDLGLWEVLGDVGVVGRVAWCSTTISLR